MTTSNSMSVNPRNRPGFLRTYSKRTPPDKHRHVTGADKHFSASEPVKDT
jgi:hypothetical protein